MKEEKSAGAIIFYKDKNEIKFLLLKYKNYWGFVKGLIEENESIEDTIKRETLEEANIEIKKFIPKFEFKQHWFFKWEGKLVRKEAIFLLAEITKEQAEKVKISFEHEDFKWLNYNEAIKLIKIKNNKEMLTEAHEFIKKGYQKTL